MTGLKLLSKTHEERFHEEHVVVRAPQGHSGTIWIFQRFLTKIEKGYALFLHLVGSSRNEIQGNCWSEQRQEGSEFLTRFANGSESWPVQAAIMTYCLWLIWKRRKIFSILQQRANRSVFCYDTVPAEFLTRIINFKNGTEKFVRAQTKERESLPTKKNSRDHSQPRKISGNKSETKNHCTRDSWGKPQASWRFWKKTKRAKVANTNRPLIKPTVCTTMKKIKKTVDFHHKENQGRVLVDEAEDQISNSMQSENLQVNRFKKNYSTSATQNRRMKNLLSVDQLLSWALAPLVWGRGAMNFGGVCGVRGDEILNARGEISDVCMRQLPCCFCVIVFSLQRQLSKMASTWRRHWRCRGWTGRTHNV